MKTKNNQKIKERLEAIFKEINDALLNYEEYNGNKDIDDALNNARDEIETALDEVKNE